MLMSLLQLAVCTIVISLVMTFLLRYFSFFFVLDVLVKVVWALVTFFMLIVFALVTVIFVLIPTALLTGHVSLPNILGWLLLALPLAWVLRYRFSQVKKVLGTLFSFKRR